MFERYVEKSRRVIFFSRYEASQLSSPYIELEHLFLGLARESRAVLELCGVSPESISQIEDEIGRRRGIGPKILTSVDLPLSGDCKLALGYAAEDAQRLKDSHIRPEHLFLGLLRLDYSDVVKTLAAHGVTYQSALTRATHGKAIPPARRPIAESLTDAVERIHEATYIRGTELEHIDDVKAAMPVKVGGWNSKQILGHLIDSASNNHQRIVRALIQGELEFPNYIQEPWVNTQHYFDADWQSLIRLWIAYNQHLLWVIAHIPEDKLGIVCRIGPNEPITLKDVIVGYADHMDKHLNQIQGRTMTGASGI